MRGAAVPSQQLAGGDAGEDELQLQAVRIARFTFRLSAQSAYGNEKRVGKCVIEMFHQGEG